MFEKEDLITEAFEMYSELDSLGRCGVAYANVCSELMSTGERGRLVRLSQLAGILSNIQKSLKVSERPTLTFFYNWLYISALKDNEELAFEVIRYDSFSDIEFNEKKSINCQAIAAAIYVGLVKGSMLEKALSSKESFLSIVYGQEKTYKQISLFD